jgi:hypothetical protein
MVLYCIAWHSVSIVKRALLLIHVEVTNTLEIGISHSRSWLLLYLFWVQDSEHPAHQGLPSCCQELPISLVCYRFLLAAHWSVYIIKVTQILHLIILLLILSSMSSQCYCKDQPAVEWAKQALQTIYCRGFVIKATHHLNAPGSPHCSHFYPASVHYSCCWTKGKCHITRLIRHLLYVSQAMIDLIVSLTTCLSTFMIQR